MRDNIDHPAVQMALKLGPKYGINAMKDPDSVFHLIKYFRRLALAIGALSEDEQFYDKSKFEGLKLLDLACGTENLPLKNKKFAPWICRATSSLGADATGVDIEYPTMKKVRKKKKKNEKVPSSEQGWHFVQRDLTEEGAIDQETFPSDHYDVVVCTAFAGYTDATLDDPSIATFRDFFEDDYWEFVERIDAQAIRVLKESGIYMKNDTIYTKTNGKMLFKKDFPNT